jgi:signal transduction histidine kinase
VSDQGVEIVVRDSGIGIAQSDIEKLGKPFAQAETAATRTKEGTGLGLALVKSLAVMHGGEAVLESALGFGTTVNVLLPFAALMKGEGDRPAANKQILLGAA